MQETPCKLEPEHDLYSSQWPSGGFSNISEAEIIVVLKISILMYGFRKYAACHFLYQYLIGLHNLAMYNSNTLIVVISAKIYISSIEDFLQHLQKAMIKHYSSGKQANSPSVTVHSFGFIQFWTFSFNFQLTDYITKIWDIGLEDRENGVAQIMIMQLHSHLAIVLTQYVSCSPTKAQQLQHSTTTQCLLHCVFLSRKRNWSEVLPSDIRGCVSSISGI